MARPAKFTPDDILDATSAAVGTHGPAATIAQVSAQIGAPVGSIYHRFPSREHLMTRLWLRAIRRFHVGLLDTGRISDPREALLAQAVHQPRFCRENPRDAFVMSLHSQRQLMTSCPKELRQDVADVNDDIWALGRDQMQALYGTSQGHIADVVALGIRQTPYGMIRTHIRNQLPIPVWIDDAVLAASSAILDLAKPTSA